MNMYFSLVFGLLFFAPLFAEKQTCVIPDRGHFRIHVGTAGLFGAFGHDHLIEAQKIQGCASIDSGNLAQSSVKLTFTTAGLQVLDPKEDAEDRAEIQKTMETEVLAVSEYPQITFESAAIEPAVSPNQFRVHGRLTIRGRTHPATIPVTLSWLSDGSYRITGEYKFRQTAFGIRPIRLAGGTIKVKDQLRTEFEIFLK
jgi:polyisoprenoid-binding protein YceI